MPRSSAQKRPTAATCACPRSWADAHRRTDGSNLTRRSSPRGAPGEIRSSPSMQAPSNPATREGIKRRPPKGRRARRQSRTGHGRADTRKSPRPPAYPPLSPRRSLKEGPDKTKRKPMMIIRGRNAPPTPNPLFNGVASSCQEASRKILPHAPDGRSKQSPWLGTHTMLAAASEDRAAFTATKPDRAWLQGRPLGRRRRSPQFP